MEALKKIKGKVRSLLSLPFLEDELANDYYRYQHLLKFPFDDVVSIHENIDPSIKNYFNECERTWRMMEYHFCYTENAFITPQDHWAITEKMKTIKQSAWSYYEHGLPKPDRISLIKGGKNKRQLKEAISIHTGWMNYWHFYNDILGQLALADRAGLSKLPVVIPLQLSQRKYFKELLTISQSLNSREWIFQLPNEYIQAGELHFFSAPYAHRKNFDAVLEYIDYGNNNPFDEPKSKKLFITRNKESGRSLTNLDSIEKMMREQNFTIIDCNELTIKQQMQYFKSAEIIVAIHGAALANIIYRRSKPLHILEIFPEGFYNPCYYWMARQYGFNYTAIKGTMLISRGGISEFTIETEKINRSLSF